MVRLENGSVVSVAEARSGQCGVCGNNLKFKDEKVNEQQTIPTAKHCGKIYTIGQSSTATVSASPDPEYKKREYKITEKQAKAKKFRQQGKNDEAVKLEEEIQEDAQKLNEDAGSDEPAGRKAQESGEEKKSNAKRF